MNERAQENLKTSKRRTASSSETVLMPNGGQVDMTQKMGWATVDQSGVPYLANKKELHIDSTYQRTMISETRVAAITQSWSWVACGSVIISERPDKTLWVIDGQHRVAAAQRRSDIKELPCLVFKCSTPEEEALAFYRANCVRGNVTPYDKLRAMVAASDQLSIDVVHLMESEGYEPSTGDGANTVRCVSAFVSAMKLHRGALLRVWPLIAKLHDGLSIKKTVFSALLYIARFGTDDITKPEWQARVLKHGLHELEAGIAMLSRVKSIGGAKVQAWAALDVINKGVVRSKRIELVESSSPDEA
jgi:hypothetical protein